MQVLVAYGLKDVFLPPTDPRDTGQPAWILLFQLWGKQQRKSQLGLGGEREPCSQPPGSEQTQCKAGLVAWRDGRLPGCTFNWRLVRTEGMLVGHRWGQKPAMTSLHWTERRDGGHQLVEIWHALLN